MKKDYIKAGVRVRCLVSDVHNIGAEHQINVRNQAATITAVHVSQSYARMIYVKWDTETLNNTDAGKLAWLNPHIHFALLECPENDLILKEIKLQEEEEAKSRQEHANQYL